MSRFADQPALQRPQDVVTDGDGWLGQTIRHSGAARGGERGGHGLAGRCAALTDGCAGWFDGWLRRYGPAFEGAGLR